jgi:hypothetical protein
MFFDNTKRSKHVNQGIGILFTAQVVLVVVLVWKQWSFAQCPEEEKTRIAVKVLQHGNQGELRGATIFLSVHQLKRPEVIEAIIHNDDPFYSDFAAISLIGKTALRDLFPYLQAPETRMRALWGIALIGELDGELVAALQRYAQEHPMDQQLETIVLLFSSAIASQQEREQLLQRLEMSIAKTDVVENLEGFFYHAAVSFANTRAWGLRLLRPKFEAAISEFSRSGESAWFGTCILAYGFASRTAPLEAIDLDLLKRARVALAKDANARMAWDVGLGIIIWMAEGKKRSDLAPVLREMGAAVPDMTFDNPGSYTISFIADSLFQPSDVPVFVACAADPKLEEASRVGAIYLLGYCGGADARVHQVLLAGLQSESTAIRLISVLMLGSCVNLDEHAYQALQAQYRRVAGKGESEETVKFEVSLESSVRSLARFQCQSIVDALFRVPEE